MNLVKPVPPVEYVFAMQSGLAEFTDPDDTAAALLRRNHVAYEVYTLNLQKFLKPEDLEIASTSLGWRFMTADPAGDMACHMPKSASLRILGVARTRDVHVALHRLRELEQRAIRKLTARWQRVPEHDFELRGLRIPSMLIEGVWLHRPKQHPRDMDTDFLVPCLGFVNARGEGWSWELESLEPYSPKEFLDKIRDACKKRLVQKQELRSNEKRLALRANSRSLAAHAGRKPRLPQSRTLHKTRALHKKRAAR